MVGVIAAGILAAGITITLRSFMLDNSVKAVDAVALTPPASSSVVPEPPPEMSRPKQLKIESQGISAPIEPVGLTAEGDMATPPDEVTLGWYGVVPGRPGNAVLAGHTGYPDQPSSFRKFEQLKTGDIVEVKDDKGVTASFQIIQVATYLPDEAPRHIIFGPSTTERLTLITCTGTWLPAKKTYSHRLVIYAVRQE